MSAKDRVKVFQSDGQVAWTGEIDALMIVEPQNGIVTVDSHERSVLVLTSSFRGFVVLQAGVIA